MPFGHIKILEGHPCLSLRKRWQCEALTKRASAIKGDFLELKQQTQGFSLKNKSALVIGCGGLGCNAAVHLAGAGIGRLILCDCDTVSESNLNRQFLYTKEDISKSKVLCAKERLKLYAPDCEIITVNKRITDISDLKFSADCDIIFSCVDNNEARLISEDFCRENNIPLVHGGIDGFYGVAYLYLPSHSPAPSEAGLCEGSKAKYNISSVAGVIGSLQASLGVRYLTTDDKTLSGRILIFDEDKTDTLNIKF